MKKRLQLHFETAVALLSVVAIAALVWWFFGSLYVLLHPENTVYFNHGPQDQVDTH